MTWRAYAVLIGAATLLGSGWAQAKGPACGIRVEAVEFTRPSYPVGRWFSGRVVGEVYDTYGTGQMVAPGTAVWDECFRDWEERSTILRAFEVTTGQWVDIDLFADLGDIVIAGQIDPLQAGGRYVIDGEDISGLHFLDEVAFEVDANPDADLDPPELVGFRVAQGTRAGRMPASEWRFADRSPLSRWGKVWYRPVGREGSHDDWLNCEGRVCASGHSAFGLPAGSYAIGGLMVWDALGNGVMIEDHPLFEGVVIRVGSGEQGSVVRGNLTGTPLPDSVLPPPVALDKVVTAPRPEALPDEPGVDSPAYALDRADAPSSHPDCRAAPSGAGQGGWALLLLLAACRRRARR